MDDSLSLTPTGPLSPLQMSTPDRINQRRDSNMSPFRADGYESPVLEKISQFNNMSGRKTTDALKRAILGREEAEVEMRRLRDEITQLQSAVDQGKDRERKVGERLETVMVRRLGEWSHNIDLLTTVTGQLWTRKRNTRTHTGFVGKGNSPSEKRKL